MMFRRMFLTVAATAALPVTAALAQPWWNDREEAGAWERERERERREAEARHERWDEEAAHRRWLAEERHRREEEWHRTHG